MADPISKHVRELHDAVSVFGKTLKAAAKEVDGLTVEEIQSVMTGVVSETEKTLELAARGRRILVYRVLDGIKRESCTRPKLPDAEWSAPYMDAKDATAKKSRKRK